MQGLCRAGLRSAHVKHAQVVAEGAPRQSPPQQELPAITQSREELMALPVRELKGMLQDRSIDMTGAGASVLLIIVLRMPRMQALCLLTHFAQCAGFK